MLGVVVLPPRRYRGADVLQEECAKDQCQRKEALARLGAFNPSGTAHAEHGNDVESASV